MSDWDERVEVAAQAVNHGLRGEVWSAQSLARAALAAADGRSDDRRMVDQAVGLLRETSRLLHFQPVIPVAEERELRDAVDAFLREFGGSASDEEK